MTELEALSALRGDDPVRAARAEAALWEMWHRSGDPRLDSLLLEGIEAIERKDLPTAGGALPRPDAGVPELCDGGDNAGPLPYPANGVSCSDARLPHDAHRTPY